MPNHLTQTTSPYLLQHANNPVDWFPWGPEALQIARSKNMPIFLSIGYSACHWCHVMAHESFEDPETAALMNAHFVNIKVDREERPDLDEIYMSATVALTGSGGWPMSVFLTPDLQPFYAGTYFPPTPRHGLPSFTQVLQALAGAWQSDRERITETSHKLADHLLQAAAIPRSSASLDMDLLDRAARNLLDSYDWSNGGWGPAPKFPQPMAIEFLLRQATRDAKPAGSATKSPTGKTALHALKAMARGGMYDVVGGGFARYSTDDFWRVPHFEKMLYDNAQLSLAYLHAWQLTGDPFCRRVTEETLDFILREMSAPGGGFYSSLDADSEGEEGRYYAWSRDELEAVTGMDFPLFQAAYGITHPSGNWEGRWILQRMLDDSSLAARFKLDEEAVTARLTDCHSRLLSARSIRVRPATDDKILTAWNALMLSAFAQAAQTPTLPRASHYLDAATRNAKFLLTSLRADGRLRRSWRDGQTGHEAFLEDYAALILALLDLYQADFDPHWFAEARCLADEMLDRFSDPAGGFYDTPADGEALLLRPRTLQDNAVPSGSALACEALLKLDAFTGEGDYREIAGRAMSAVLRPAAEHPTAFARWLSAADFALGPVRQVAVVGDPQTFLTELHRGYDPRRVTAASALPLPEDAPALLRDRPLLGGKPTAYVCQGFVCKIPVTDPNGLKQQLGD
jgi:uncharacterized protein YyaL (SSP411 family)